MTTDTISTTRKVKLFGAFGQFIRTDLTEFGCKIRSISVSCGINKIGCIGASRLPARTTTTRVWVAGRVIGMVQLSVKSRKISNAEFDGQPGRDGYAGCERYFEFDWNGRTTGKTRKIRTFTKW